MKNTKSLANPYAKNIEITPDEIALLVDVLSKVGSEYEEEVTAYKSKHYEHLMNRKMSVEDVYQSEAIKTYTLKQVHASFLRDIIKKLLKAQAEFNSDNQLT